MMNVNAVKEKVLYFLQVDFLYPKLLNFFEVMGNRVNVKVQRLQIIKFTERISFYV
jgi:hypothetical protein